MKKLIIILVGWTVFYCNAFATPSTQIWNPSTDIQPFGSWHFGIDNYFTLEGPAQGGYAFPTDVGLTYGILSGIEMGIDMFAPQTAPLVINMKYGSKENGSLPSFALGGFGFGTQQGVTDQNVIYGIAAKTFSFGRISMGYFTGNEKVLGSGENSGAILSWDAVINDRLWLCVDHCGTRSLLGSTYYGISWAFSANTSVIFGYGTYNNGTKPTVTTQLDINI